jgi:mono/diheme cytochrome c family protein
MLFSHTMKTSTLLQHLSCGALVATLVACAPGNGSPHALKQSPATSSSATTFTPSPGSMPAGVLGEARQIFSMRCSPCHGAEGRGDGPASAALTPHPRNFNDADWQKQSSDDHIMKIIQYGGVAVGRSPAMPANPDLGEKPEVVAALKDHIRSLAR